jgi:hypothetical protein
MKKFAANYLVSDTGDFLKNSILVAEDDGTVLEYIDTKGHLKEIARLVFYNGILLAAFNFVRVHEARSFDEPDNRLSSFLLAEAGSNNEVSIYAWLDACKKVQEYFPDMAVTEIFEGVTEFLVTDGGFRKESVPGVFLLTGSNLEILKLSQNSKLKRIL